MLLSREVIYYDFGDFRIDVAGERLLKNGTPLPLTYKAFSTLLILVKNAGKIVEKEDLIAEIWADSFVEESNLSQYIYVLRKLLGEDENRNPYIETITKRGFRFTAQVTEVSAERTNDHFSSEIINDQRFPSGKKLSENGFANTTAAASSSSAQLSSEPSRTDSKISALPSAEELPKKNRLGIRFLLLAICIVALISAAAALVYKTRQTSNLPPVGRTKSIAVLPFKTIGVESDNEKLGFGMADAIITRLGRAKQITVRPTSAIFQYTDAAAIDSSAAGRELNVDAVLEGTIQRDGERVRVSVSLVNVESGESVWADTFDEKFTNIFALQDSISDSVAKSLSISLTPPEKNVRQQPPPPTVQTEAYQAYLLGVYFWNKRTKEDLEKGIVNFRRAIELDPNYAQAFAGLADCYNLLGHYSYADRGEMAIKGREAAEKAIALNDTLAEAHIAMAFVQADSEKARQYLERAIELSPYNSTARVRYGWNLLRVGNPETLEAAEKQMRLAQEYDPLSHVSNGALCSILRFRRNFDEAIRYCEKSVELSPPAGSAQSRLVLADALFLKGRHDEAIAAAKTEIEKGRVPDDALGMLALYYAKLGRRAEAEKILGELKPKAEKDSRHLLNLTLIAYALGKKEESIGYLRRAREKEVLPRYMGYDPVWEDVLRDPEIRKLLS